MKDSWKGKVVRFLECTCYDCDMMTAVSRIADLYRERWSKNGGFWRCPDCEQKRRRLLQAAKGQGKP